jgi:phosphotriesterase-related protein
VTTQAGQVQAVPGAIAPETMGVTRPHEHLLIDFSVLENSYYPYNPSFDMPNDGGRMAHVLALIEAGYGDRLLLSHDIASKTSLVKYGGDGYHHLLVNVVPRLRRKGVDDAGLRKLLVENPERAFVFA